MKTDLLEQAQKLPLDDQLELVGELRDSITQRCAVPLTQKQKEELDRRLADLDANPDDVIPWEEVLIGARRLVGR